jgi:hypothetical protein
MIPLPSLSDTLSPIQAALDAATHDERLHWMRGLGRKQLRALYTLADGNPVALEHFVERDGSTAIHWGQNSLPMFNHFQKRFHKVGGTMQGYNHNSPLLTSVTGPGHFTARAEADEILIDYAQLPAGVPEDFPALLDNEGGLRKFVFGGMQDRMRKISTHCTIGGAEKGGKPMGAWFMLVREPRTDGS